MCPAPRGYTHHLHSVSVLILHNHLHLLTNGPALGPLTGEGAEPELSPVFQGCIFYHVHTYQPITASSVCIKNSPRKYGHHRSDITVLLAE